LAFLIALGAAALTALSYAELVGRFPHSGGASHYCHQGFRRERPALLVGWLVFCSGVVSMATLSQAFAGYFGRLVPTGPDWFFMVVFLLGVCWINFWGIEFSSTANVVCTAIEASGLIIIIVAGLWYLSGDPRPVAGVNDRLAETVPWLAVLQAGALAFYACIGFEDMVNVAEEARRPQHDLPLAILAALGCAGILYLAVVAISVAVVAPDKLGNSAAPLLDVLHEVAPTVPSGLFTLIPLFAVANSALLNGIMASRLLYGMSRERLLPLRLSRVHASRRTPHVAIGVVLAVAVGLALSGTLVFLAGTASVLLLGVFVLVHLALLVVKLRDPVQPPGFRIPWLVPAVGALVSASLLFFAPRESLIPAALLLGVGLGIVGARGLTGGSQTRFVETK
jgi:amino acid transporter